MDQRIPFLFINQRRNPCPGYVILNVSSGETRTEGLNLDPNYQCMYSNGTWALLWEYAYQQADIVAVRLMLLNLEEACGKTIGMLIADEAGDGVYPHVPLTGTFIGEPSRNDFQIFLMEGIDDDNFCTLWKSSFENDFEDGEIIDDGDITISWTRHQIKIPGGYDDAYSLIHWDTNLYWIGTGGVFSYNLETEEVTSYHFLVGIKHSNDQLGNGPRAYLFTRNSHVLYVCASSDEDICIGVLAKNDDVGLIIPLNTFLTSDDGEINLLDTILSPLDGDIRLLGGGALFLNRRQAGIYIENVSLLNFVNTLSEGPHPHDCKTYNLTTEAWRLQRHCNLENCQGVWFLSENENLGRCMLRISHLLCPLERLLKEKEKREEEEGEEEEGELMVINQELLFQLTMDEDLLWRLTEPESWQETTRHSSFSEASTSAQAEDAPLPHGLTLEALQALGKEGAQVLVYSGSLEGNSAMPHPADTPCSKSAPIGVVALGTPAAPPVSSIFTLPFTAFKVLHDGEGPIHSVKWRTSLIAWAKEAGVKIYDMASNQRIAFIERPRGTPRAEILLPHLVWQDDTLLVIGWGTSIKIAAIRGNQQNGPNGLKMNMMMPNARYVDIVASFQTSYHISGVAPYGDALVVLAYIPDEQNGEKDFSTAVPSRQGTAHRPEVRIVTWKNDEVTTDALPVHGYEHYRAKDYALGHAPFTGSSYAGGQWAEGDEPLYYIVSPKDIVIARPRDAEDHIAWLIQHGWHEKALAAVEAGQGRTELLDEVGARYLDRLIIERRYAEAASRCPKLLRGSTSAWERTGTLVKRQ